MDSLALFQIVAPAIVKELEELRKNKQDPAILNELVELRRAKSDLENEVAELKKKASSYASITQRTVEPSLKPFPPPALMPSPTNEMLNRMFFELKWQCASPQWLVLRSVYAKSPELFSVSALHTSNDDEIPHYRITHKIPTEKSENTVHYHIYFLNDGITPLYATSLVVHKGTNGHPYSYKGAVIVVYQEPDALKRLLQRVQGIPYYIRALCESEEESWETENGMSSPPQ